MRVALFTEILVRDGGGSSIAVRNFALGLKQLGHIPTIYSIRSTYGKSLLEKLSLQYVFLNPFFFVPQISLDVAQAYASIRALLPGLIIINEMFTTYWIGLICGTLLHIPIIAYFHTYYFKNQQTDRVLWDRLIRFVSEKYMRFCLMRVTTIMVPSESAKHYLIHSLQIPQSTIQVCPYPVFQDNPNQVTRSVFLKNKVHFVYSGRFVKGKNLKELIDTFSHLKNHNWELTLIGSGKENRNLQHQIRSKNLTDMIHLKPFMPREELLALYSDFDIFISLSTMETFGYTYFEALAQGLKLICVDYSVTREFFKDCRDVQILKKDDPQEMAKHLDTLISHSWHTTPPPHTPSFLSRYTYRNAASILMKNL